MKKIDVQRMLELAKLLAAFQAIDRISYLPGREQENDVEHSYNLAIFAWYLAQDSPGLDTDKVVRYALVHDLIEVHAGDTFAFANQEEKAAKHARETAALEQLANEWPDFPQLIQWIRDYEARQDPESVFVHALDKVTPSLFNYLDGGRVWKEKRIDFETYRANRLEASKHDPLVAAYFDELLKLLTKDKDRLFPG